MQKRGKPDHFAQRARREGYKARSVYKLAEIDGKSRLISRGNKVLDMGAAPGSWTQYALKRVGPDGRVVAVDLKPVELSADQRLTIIEGDVTAEAVRSQLRAAGPFDVVLSDAAPSTSGNRTLDSARSAELVEIVLQLTDELLVSGGNMAVKLFQGGEERELLEATRARFEHARVQRPKASRSDSFEIYLVATGHASPPSDDAGEDEEDG
jgi:23S rRNA (uridine2552-2'-O)-methyltransferase